MNQHCPISLEKSDETTNRIATSLVVLSLILFLIIKSIFILIFLITDFILRIAGLNSFSPIYQASKGLQKIFKLESNMVDSAPKKFATIIGFIFILIITILVLFKLYFTLFIVAIAYLICAIMDAVFGFCIACLIYPYVARFNGILFAKGE